MSSSDKADVSLSDNGLVQTDRRVDANWPQPILNANNQPGPEAPVETQPVASYVPARRGRGRPRVTKGRDESAIEKRRAQVREAQRTYQKRKDTATATEKRRVDELLQVLSDLSSDVEALLQASSKAGAMHRDDDVSKHIQRLWASYDAAINNASVAPELRLLRIKNGRRVANHHSSRSFIINAGPSDPTNVPSDSAAVPPSKDRTPFDPTEISFELVRFEETTVLQPFQRTSSVNGLMAGRSIFDICKERQAAMKVADNGATYDWIAPKLQAWRASRGEVPVIVSGGNLEKDYAYPRTFEAGESWNYSGSFDWASLLVERLTKMSFEDYVETNIAKPLGISSSTWHLSRKPAVEKKLMSMSSRQENGTVKDGPTPFRPDPDKEGGGAGMYSSVPDDARVLSDLLKDAPDLLKRETVDQMFTPQFSKDSPTLKGLVDNSEYAYGCALDRSLEDVVPNFGLGSLLLMEDVDRENYFKPKGSLSWTGLPNLLWTVNRERGLALVFATQVLPWADQNAFDLIARFETAVWRNLRA